MDDVTSEVIPDVSPRKFATTVEDAPLPPPALAAATLAEMEAGRINLKAVADEKARLQAIIAAASAKK